MKFESEGHGGADNPQNFYKPITDVSMLSRKLELILEKPIISDGALFGAITDTFFVCQKQNARSGEYMITNGEIQSVHSEDVEVISKDPNSKEPTPFSEYVSFYYEKISPEEQEQRQESVCLEFHDGNEDFDEPLFTVRLNRKKDGIIENSSFVEESNGEMKLISVEDEMRRKIIEILLEGAKLKKSNAVIYFYQN
jgi:hypothetical protein